MTSGGARQRALALGTALWLTAAPVVAEESADQEAAAEPWLEPAFSVPADLLLAAAAKVPVPPGTNAQMLSQDVEITVDADHRVTYRRRWLYRILESSALATWSLSEARWLPWHQERPEVRARVLTPEGPIWVDPSVFRGDPRPADALGDGALVLRATLPEVRVGTMVEEEIVVRDREPYFAAGLSRRELLVLPVPIHRGRLVIQAPASLPLRHLVRLPPNLRVTVDEDRHEVGGVVRWTVRYEDMPAALPIPAGLPPERTRYPHAAWSTGADWQSVAAAYSELIDAAVAGGASLPDFGSGGGLAQTERMEEILAGVRERWRHETVSLGTTSIMPSSVPMILDHDRADAKDLATMVVALLRAEGIPAYVALSSSGPGSDIAADLPGLGVFDHALVFLPAGSPIWIDPADRFSRVGELAASRRQRRALVASPTTRGLITTPVAKAEANRTSFRIDIELSPENGPARIVETSEYHGEAERQQRLLAGSLDVVDRRRGYLDYVRSVYHARELGFVEETAAANLTVPYRLRLEAIGASRGFTADDEAAAAIQFQDLLAQLPPELFGDGSPSGEDDFVLPAPFIAEWRYRIIPPPGLKPVRTPENAVKPLADVGSLAYRVAIDGEVLTVDLRLESGPARLDAAQLVAYRENLSELIAEEPLVFWFERSDER